MNNWMTLEEFQKEAVDQFWFGWCWIYIDGSSEMAYYLEDFYFSEDADCDEIWNINKITHFITLDNPKDPE